MIIFRNLDAAYEALLAATLESDALVDPRGQPTRELTNVLLKIENPRGRFVTNPMRKWNFALAFGELAWHLAGSRDVEALAAYAKIWRRYSTGSLINGSCYGHRIFSQIAGRRSQWEICKEALQADRFTRRAVIQLYDPEQNVLESPDVSCAMNLQFSLRNQALDLTVFMRSNDVYFGFPYDVYLYSNLQELMASELGVSLGGYYHFVTSLHLYERDVAKARSVLEHRHSTEFSDLPLMRPEERVQFCNAEASIRLGDQRHQSVKFSDDFWRQKYWFLLEASGNRPKQSIYSQICHSN